MNRLENQLKIQFNRAVQLGWINFFVEAVNAHTESYFDVADLMGIASRETNLDPVWLTKAGDGGHGYGLMQADVRSFPEWIKSGKWRDAREGILMGARVLMEKLSDVQNCIGKRCEVHSSKTKTVFTFIAKRVTGGELQSVVIAAYNGGRWAHYAVSKGQNIDKYTTGGDYSADVQQRARFFRPLVKKWMEDFTPADNVDLDNQVLTPTSDSTVAVLPLDRPETAEPEKSKVKEFSEKYLKHCPQDKVRNILAVICLRAGSTISSLWVAGLHGQILLIVAGIALIGFSGYALYQYSSRIFGYAKDIADSFISNEA